MLGRSWNHSADIFDFQREADRLVNQFRADVPTRAHGSAPPYPLQVHTADECWRIEIPIPGVDPAAVNLEVAGRTIVVRVKEEGGRNDGRAHWEQTLTLPRILDLDGARATHRHGMLVLMVPLKESMKRRRIQIEGVADTQKQLTTA